MSVPLIEETAGSSVGSSGSTGQVDDVVEIDPTGNGPGGPSISISFSDGSTVVLGVEDLQLWLATIQTLLLLYVTWKEVSG